MVVNWVADAGANNWNRQGQSCLGADGATTASAPVVIPAVTLDDVRRLGLPAGTANVEPAGGEVALNVPANVYAAAAPITRTVELLGFDVTIVATPVTYTWSFGDGTTLGPTSDPGSAYPQMTTTHTYTRPGTYGVTLTTSYSARYDVAGLGFQDIAGTVDVSSTAVPLTARAGTNILTS